MMRAGRLRKNRCGRDECPKVPPLEALQWLLEGGIVSGELEVEERSSQGLPPLEVAATVVVGRSQGLPPLEVDGGKKKWL